MFFPSKSCVFKHSHLIPISMIPFATEYEQGMLEREKVDEFRKYLLINGLKPMTSNIGWQTYESGTVRIEIKKSPENSSGSFVIGSYSPDGDINQNLRNIIFEKIRDLRSLE